VWKTDNQANRVRQIVDYTVQLVLKEEKKKKASQPLINFDSFDEEVVRPSSPPIKSSHNVRPSLTDDLQIPPPVPKTITNTIIPPPLPVTPIPSDSIAIKPPPLKTNRAYTTPNHSPDVRYVPQSNPFVINPIPPPKDLVYTPNKNRIVKSRSTSNPFTTPTITPKKSPSANLIDFD